MDDAEKQRRRKLALQKLARVFKGDEPARRPASNAYGVLAERKILTTILRTTTQPEIASLVRDRLAVISLDSDSDADDAPTPAPAAAANEARARLEAEKSAEVTTWLREVANGTRPVPGILASPEYWEELGAPAKDAANARGRERYRARMKLRARCEPALAPEETIVWPHLGDDYNDERLSIIRRHLRETATRSFHPSRWPRRTQTRTAARTAARSSRVQMRKVDRRRRDSNLRSAARARQLAVGGRSRPGQGG